MNILFICLSHFVLEVTNKLKTMKSWSFSCYLSKYVCLALAMVWFGVLGGASQSIANSSTEHKIKSAFLYHFVQFTEWPKEAFLSPEDPVRICVYGRDPFDQTLDATFEGKVVKQRHFVVEHDVRISDLRNCHIAYIGSSEVMRTTTMRQTLKDSYALTVGGTDHFIEYGGMIQFFRSLNTIRFAVSPTAVEQKNLKLSSKLLRLAKIVKSR